MQRDASVEPGVDRVQVDISPKESSCYLSVGWLKADPITHSSNFGLRPLKMQIAPCQTKNESKEMLVVRG